MLLVILELGSKYGKGEGEQMQPHVGDVLHW